LLLVVEIDGLGYLKATAQVINDVAVLYVDQAVETLDLDA
jgi:hypothetical protein